MPLQYLTVMAGLIISTDSAPICVGLVFNTALKIYPTMSAVLTARRVEGGSGLFNSGHGLPSRVLGAFVGDTSGTAHTLVHVGAATTIAYFRVGLSHTLRDNRQWVCRKHLGPNLVSEARVTSGHDTGGTAPSVHRDNSGPGHPGY
jgi:hypothetical protein